MKGIFQLRFREQLGTILVIILGHLGVAGLIVWSYEAFMEETGFMVQMFSQFEDLFRGFIGVGFSLDELTASYLGMTWRHPLILFILMGFGVSRSLGISREIDSGTGDLLFSLPLRRSKIILAEFITTSVGLLIINLSLVLGVYFWSRVLSIQDIPGFYGFFWVFIISFFLHIMFSAFSLFIVCIVKSARKATAWSIGIISVLYLGDFLAGMQPQIEAIHPFTVFYHYQVPEALAGNALWFETLLFLILTLVFFTAASFFIQRRDL